MGEAGEDATTMEEELERWALHDCSAFRDAREPDEMKRLFERFRATRGKPVTVTTTVTIRSLDRAWTAFVKRWNLEGCDAFESMLRKREADHARLSVGELAAQVCRLSREQDRRCCIAHFEDGCPRCRERGDSRPDREEWRRIVEVRPITEVEREVIGRYQRTLDEARRGGRQRPRRDPLPVRGLPRTPPRSPGRQRGERREVPNYPAWDPASAPNSAAGRGSYWRGAGRRDAWAERGNHRAPEFDRRYDGHVPPYQQEAPDRRVRMEDRREWEDAAEVRRLRQRLEELERENQDLRRRMQRQRDEWGGRWYADVEGPPRR